MMQSLMQMDQKSLLRWIDMVSLCQTEMNLYLDTHPEDTDAMNYFENYRKMRMEAMEVYEKKYAPLLLDNTKPSNYWRWVMTPWPWEGGC